MRPKKKTYTSAPLPFQGQKRNFIKLFKAEIEKLPKGTIFVDLFGGSGLLSRAAKDVHPESKVIYNDFDGYSKRLRMIDKTNVLISDLREIVKNEPIKCKLPNDIKRQILDRIKNEKGCVDWRTLSSQLLFSMNYAFSLEEIGRGTMYNRVIKTPYCCDDYLDGLTVVSCDYKELLTNDKNVVFLLDPPYMTTNNTSYTSESYWGLSKHLEIIGACKDRRYFYFTSSKSELLELNDFLEKKLGAAMLGVYRKVVISTSASYNSSLEDIMLTNI